MTTGLEKQRVGQDGADRGQGERACQHVLRAVQQDTHGKSTLLFRLHRSDLRATAATARHLFVVLDHPFRHFSSPDGLALVILNAARASASRYCWQAPRPPAA